MISEYKKKDSSKVLYVINDAAIKYKGVIPDNCWHEPYMSEQQLINEFNDGVRMFGCNHNNKLVGVIGIQKVKDAILIRHAYILTSHQGEGVGSLLLKYLLEKKKNSRLLVGTWQKAIWAIQFYEKYGFVLKTKKQTNQYSKNIGRYH